MPRPAVSAVVLVALLVLAGCDEEPAEPSITDASMPESVRQGIQATGTLDGARVAISRGNPTVVLGDCDANDGLDEDLCVRSRTIDGLSVNLVIENPAVLVAGAQLDVGGGDCDTDCDQVTDRAVVEVRVDGDARRADGGTLRVLEAGERWSAEFDLDLPGTDRLIGEFDVEVTPPE